LKNLFHYRNKTSILALALGYKVMDKI